MSYTPDQIIELVEAAYERGFSMGARNAYDTVAFIDGYDEPSGTWGGYASPDTNDEVCADPSKPGLWVPDEPDSSEYDALYLEVTGQKVDDILDRVMGLERWAFGTPQSETTPCPCSECRHTS